MVLSVTSLYDLNCKFSCWAFVFCTAKHCNIVTYYMSHWNELHKKRINDTRTFKWIFCLHHSHLYARNALDLILSTSQVPIDCVLTNGANDRMINLGWLKFMSCFTDIVSRVLIVFFMQFIFRTIPHFTLYRLPKSQNALMIEHLWMIQLQKKGKTVFTELYLYISFMA